MAEVDENNEDDDDVESKLTRRIKFLAVAGRTGRLTSPSMVASKRHFYEGREEGKMRIRKEGNRGKSFNWGIGFCGLKLGFRSP
ncbi:hypothetical protein TB2_019119 [Malus domestica]